VSAETAATATANRLLALSAKKTSRAAKLRVDADGLDVEARDLRAAAWALDPSTDPRPADDAAFAAVLERVDRANVRTRELRATGMDLEAAQAQAMIDCP
jgi:hypothetical protein